MKPYEIDYALANKPSLDISNVELSLESLKTLAYFTRDVRQLAKSSFHREGAGTLSFKGEKAAPLLQTAVTEEEITSAVTVFRRTYMESEPGNFAKACEVVSTAMGQHPLGKWVNGASQDYADQLLGMAQIMPPFRREKWKFSRKRLLDVFIYTRFAHQPRPDRQRQYEECLEALGGREPILIWAFLSELWACCIHLCSVGRVICSFFDAYCQCHAMTPDVILSVGAVAPGIGALEKSVARHERTLREKADETGKLLWEGAGSLPNELERYVEEAYQQLLRLFPPPAQREQ